MADNPFSLPALVTGTSPFQRKRRTQDIELPAPAAPPPPPPKTLGSSTNRPWTTAAPPSPGQVGEVYHPKEILTAFRDEHKGLFNDITDSELLDALKEEDPDTYALVDPSLIGAELLPESQPRPAPPPLTPPGRQPDLADRIIGGGLRIVPAVGASIIGEPIRGVGAAATATGVGAPPGLAAMAAGTGITAAGGGAGEAAGQWYENLVGLREGYDPRVMTAEAALNAVPLGALTNLGRGARIATRGVQGAGLGASSAYLNTLLQEERFPNAGDVLPGAAIGAGFGGATAGAAEGLSAFAGRAPSFGEATGALPGTVGAPPPGAADLLPLARAAAAQYEAEEVRLAQGLQAVFGPEAVRQPGQGDYHTALQAKDYLEQLAKLNQTPVPIPPIHPGLAGQPTPYAADVLPRMLPETAGAGAGAGPGAIRAYPPGVTPPIELVGSRAPQASQVVGARDVGTVPPPPPTLDEIVTQLLSREPGSMEPRLVLEGQPVPRGTIGRPPPLLDLPTRSQEGPIEQLPIAGGQRITAEAPRLPGTDQPAPLDRVYATGPNAGPRRPKELHGVPRSVRRRLKVGNRYRFEQAPSELPAEDPGTYPADVRRELAGVLWELQEFPYQPRTWEWADPTWTAEMTPADFTAGGGKAKIHPAVGGAQVYHDILQTAAGARAHATRDEVAAAIRAAVLEGKGSVISDAAAQIARRRLAGQAKRQGPVGAGDAIIGWVDETGAQALPEQDLSEAQMGVRDAEDQELLAAVRLWADERQYISEESLPFFEAAREEAIRRGLITHSQPGLTMEGPGGEKGPTLFDYEGEAGTVRRRGGPTAEELVGTEPPPPLDVARTPDEIAAQRTRNEAALAEAAREQGIIRDIEAEGPPPATGRRGGPSLDPNRFHPVTGEPLVKGATGELPEGSGVGTPPPVRVSGMEGPGAQGRRTPEDVILPGTEGVREQNLPTPRVAEAPFALTPPPAKEKAGAQLPPGQRSLWDKLKDEKGIITLDVIAGDRQGLRKWLTKQERDHGGEAWFARVEQAIEDGDWDRAWKAAASASVRSYSRALAGAATPQEEQALLSAVRGTPLQDDLNTQIVAGARQRAGVGEAPPVKDFPPSRRTTQAGAARGKATLGPAGIINPGARQRPLSTAAPELRSSLLDTEVVKLIMEATSAEGMATIPGNQDTFLRLYRQVGEQVFKGQNLKLLKEAGVTIPPEELAQHFNATISSWGRGLQMLQQYGQANAEVLEEAAESMSMGGALAGMLGTTPRPRRITGARGRDVGPLGATDPRRTLDALAAESGNYERSMLANSLQKRKPTGVLRAVHDASYAWMLVKWNTALRNYVSFTGRYGMDSLDHALTVPIATLMGDPGTAKLAAAQVRERGVTPLRTGTAVPPTRSWKDSLEEIYNFTTDNLNTLTPKDARRAIALLTDFPEQAAHFLGSTMGEDLSSGFTNVPVLRHLTNPTVQRFLTMFNRAQEFSARATVFDSTMRALLRAEGHEPTTLLARPIDQITQAVGGRTKLDDLLFTATSQALEATFAGRTAKDSIPGALIRVINQAWPLKLGIPFPRFNFSAAPRWIYDHSPAALLDLVRFPLDKAGITAPAGTMAGGRVFRGERARTIEQQALPELALKIGSAERRQGVAIGELISTQREMQIRSRQVGRLTKRAQTNLPGVADSLQRATEMRDQLARRRERLKAEMSDARKTVGDLKSQQTKLLEVLEDARGINAPNWSQYLARIGTGTVGMLGAAMVVRSQEGAKGTRWYEYRVDREGKDPVVLDFRPFAPFAQYLFVADVLKDFWDETDWEGVNQAFEAQEEGMVASPLDYNREIWNHYEGKYTAEELGAQFAQAFLSISRAAGTTLTITDLLTQNGWPSLQDAADSIVGTLGQFLSRFTVIGQQAGDIIGQFDPEEAKARIPPRVTEEEMTRPLAAPIANVPYARQLVPERISQTTGKPVASEYPLLRALAGIGTAPRDFVVEEVRRVGVPGQSVFIRETGDVGLDRLIAEQYASILKEELPQFLEDPEYQGLGTPARQRDYLQRYVFPVLKRGALAEVRDLLGSDRFEAATVRGEEARRKARQQRLLDQLEAAEPASPSDEESGVGTTPPGPPGVGTARPALPPGPPAL